MENYTLEDFFEKGNTPQTWCQAWKAFFAAIDRGLHNCNEKRFANLLIKEGILSEPVWDHTQCVSVDRDGEVLAHHTTDSSLSNYGQPVWVIENEDPAPGPALWKSPRGVHPLEIIGNVDGWLVVLDATKAPHGIIWTDGTYYAGAITGPKNEDITLDDLKSGDFQVEGTLPMGMLGSIL